MDQREEIKNKTDIVQLIGKYAPLKKAGRNYKALCPFHSEKTPSFMVSPELQIYKCFGCGKGGDVFTFLMEAEGMDFSEALRTLAEAAGVKLTSFRPTPAARQKQALLAAVHLASQFYHFILTQHDRGEPGKKFLKQRGITPSSIKKFQLGFAPASPSLLAKNLVSKHNIPAQDLIQAGLAFKDRRNQLIDRFWGRVIFPLFNHRSEVVGLAGRLLPADTRDTGKYINTPETPIYHKAELLYAYHLTRSAIAKAKKAVVVEGELDAISSWQAGIKNVVAIKGTALTEPQARLFSRTAQDVILALDTDTAGDEAAWRGITTAQNTGLTVKIADITPFKDPDEAAQKAPDKLKASLGSALPVFDFYLTSLTRKFRPEPEADRKRKIARAFLSKLAQEPDEIVRSHYAKKLAHQLQVSEESVISQLNQAVKPAFSPPVSSPLPSSPDSSVTRQQKLETHLLKLIFQASPATIAEIDRDLFSLPGHVRLVNLAKAHYVKYHSLAPEDLIKHLPDELKDILAQIILDQLPPKVLEQDRLKKQEIQKTTTQLIQITTHQKITQISHQLQQAEAKKDHSLQRKLQQQLTSLTKTLSSPAPEQFST